MVSHGFYRFCVPGSFQALIQYADMLSAQTAKFVSIHLTSPPLWPPPPVCVVLPLFHPSAIGAPPLSSSFFLVLSLSSRPLFFLVFFLPLFSYFLPRLQAGTAVTGRCLSAVLSRDRSKFSRGISRVRRENIFRPPPPFIPTKATARRLIAGSKAR